MKSTSGPILREGSSVILKSSVLSFPVAENPTLCLLPAVDKSVSLQFRIASFIGCIDTFSRYFCLNRTCKNIFPFKQNSTLNVMKCSKVFRPRVMLNGKMYDNSVDC